MPYNILIIDDVSKNIQVLASILNSSEYAISFATNGTDALEMIQDEEYDLILLDIMMPGMTGYEVCQRIKQMDEKKNIPVIFLTAKTQQNDINRGFQVGAVDFISKPFNTLELKARVGTHLGLKKAKDLVTEQNMLLLEKNEELNKLNGELQETLERVKTLEGVIPICCICKNIRDDEGYWAQIERYISDHSLAQFSHSICPECAKKHYPDYYKNRKKESE